MQQNMRDGKARVVSHNKYYEVVCHTKHGLQTIKKCQYEQEARNFAIVYNQGYGRR